MRQCVKNCAEIALVVILLNLVAYPANSDTTEHCAMCDASAAVAVGADKFLVANDEDNTLRVYESDGACTPILAVDMTDFLQPHKVGREADIEGATRIGDRVYWITSHGRNKKGKLRPTRYRFFATDVNVDGDEVTIQTVGDPYRGLLDDLIRAASDSGIDLKAASEKKPKAEGALNIEGLCATPSGSLLIAFRNPIPNGKALIIPLENPSELLNGEPAKLGKPILLPLGNSGVRSIEYFPQEQEYLIVAGPIGGTGDFHLYEWSGNTNEDPVLNDDVEFGDLSPEAIVVYPNRRQVLVLSDDGTKNVGGQECKDAKPEDRSFRSLWITP